MNILYRPHRELFIDSMKEVTEVGNMVEMAELLPITGKITFKDCGYDERNGWYTYYVCVDNKCVGFSNGKLEV